MTPTATVKVTLHSPLQTYGPRQTEDAIQIRQSGTSTGNIVVAFYNDDEVQVCFARQSNS